MDQEKVKSASEHNAEQLICSDQILVPVLMFLSKPEKTYLSRTIKGARALARACCVCRAFSRAGSEPYLWKKLCKAGDLSWISDWPEAADFFGGYKQLYHYLHPPEKQFWDLETVIGAKCSDEFRKKILPPNCYLLLAVRRQFSSAAKSTLEVSNKYPVGKKLGIYCLISVGQTKPEGGTESSLAECENSGAAWDFEVTVRKLDSPDNNSYHIACLNEGVVASKLGKYGDHFRISLLKCRITCCETGKSDEGELLIGGLIG